MPHEVLTPQALAQVLALDLYAAQARWQPYCFAGVSVPQREAQLLPLFISFLQPTVHGSGAGLHSARLVTGGSVVAPPSTPAAASGGSPVQTVHTSLHEVGAAAPQTSGSQHDVLVLPDVVQLQAPLRHWKSRRQVLAPPSVPLLPPELQAGQNRPQNRPAARQHPSQAIARVFFMTANVLPHETHAQTQVQLVPILGLLILFPAVHAARRSPAEVLFGGLSGECQGPPAQGPATAAIARRGT